MVYCCAAAINGLIMFLLRAAESLPQANDEIQYDPSSPVLSLIPNLLKNVSNLL